MSSIVKNITENLQKLTPAQRRLADFLLKHLEEVVFMSASTLAREAKVSESTVIRFSQVLGYRGFPDLKEALRNVLMEKLDTRKRLSSYIEKKEKEHILHACIKKDKRTLDLLIDTVSISDFEAIVSTIEMANNIFIISHRSAYAVGYYLNFYLNLLGYRAFLIKGKELSYEILSSSKEGDVVIAISFPRYSIETKDLVSFAKQRNLTIVSITDDYLSPIASEASYVLTIPTDFISFIDSLTPSISVVNAIVVALSLKKTNETENRLEELEKIWKRERIYWQDETRKGEEL